MKTLRWLTPIACLPLALASCEKKADPVPANSTTAPSGTRTDATTATPAADNTGRNRADRAPDTKSPLDQSNAAADIKITADIRRAIMDDKTMSTNAQNCKIITEKAGMVTLRGPVNTQAEKDSIEAKAKAVAGVTKVDNQLEVKVN